MRKKFSFILCVLLIFGLVPAMSLISIAQEQVVSAYLTIPEPAYGELIPQYATSEHEGLALVEIIWPFEGQTFDYTDGEYEVIFIFRPEEGYIIGSEFIPNDNVFVNGVKAHTFMAEVTDDNGEVSYIPAAKIMFPQIKAFIPEEMPEVQFTVKPVGEQNIVVNTPNTPITFRIEVTDKEIEEMIPDFCWERCDENGNVLPEYAGQVLSWGDSLTIDGIPENEPMVPRYYIGSAMINNTLKSVVFKCTYTPSGGKRNAGLAFTDVNESDWFYESVKKAVELGLVNGKSETTYAPHDKLTYAEAIKLAACMHQLYTEGAVTIASGNPWYQPYVDYCMDKGIITGAYAYTEYATRAGYMEIFANALPDSGLAAINYVQDHAIPDVAPSESYAPAIYKLYRAGILAGVDDAHNCNPLAYITRAEVASILTRMMDENARVRFTAGDDSNIPFDIIPVSAQNVVCEADKEFVLEATDNAPAGVSVDYQWTRCDASGNTLDTHPASFGKQVHITIPASEKDVPRYYMCTVLANNTRKQMLFSCVYK